jgi:hypothetical protein
MVFHGVAHSWDWFTGFLPCKYFLFMGSRPWQTSTFTFAEHKHTVYHTATWISTFSVTSNILSAWMWHTKRLHSSYVCLLATLFLHSCCKLVYLILKIVILIWYLWFICRKNVTGLNFCKYFNVSRINR